MEPAVPDVFEERHSREHCRHLVYTESTLDAELHLRQYTPSVLSEM